MRMRKIHQSQQQRQPDNQPKDHTINAGGRRNGEFRHVVSFADFQMEITTSAAGASDCRVPHFPAILTAETQVQLRSTLPQGSVV